ncbi:hypothetical protein ISS37_02080 [candidate division KSB1 bacterium]|nr:hypothetical protein [candidate division KSB1 bacterium]
MILNKGTTGARVEGVLITHGNLGKAFLSTAEGILGRQKDIVCLSNHNLSLKDFSESIKQVLKGSDRTPMFLFVDSKGGSCYNAARLAAKGMKNVFLVCGLNLPMLLSFLTKRKSFSTKELLGLVKDAGLKGIGVS